MPTTPPRRPADIHDEAAPYVPIPPVTADSSVPRRVAEAAVGLGADGPVDAAGTEGGGT